MKGVDKREAKRSIFSFSVASALNDVGAGMVEPFWPIFVTSVLGAPMSFLGFIEGLGDATAEIVKFPSGYYSDKLRKRKIFVWFGYFMAALSRIGYSVSTAAGWLVPFKIMDRSAKMRDPPRDAMLSDVTKKEERGKAFGLLNAADRFGSFLGPLIALILVMFLSYRQIFLLAAIPSFIAFFIIYKFVKESKNINKDGVSFDYKKLSLNYKMLLISSAVFSLSWFSTSFMVVFAKQYLSIGMMPVLILLLGLVSSIISIPAGRLSDKMGRKPLLILGYSLFAITCLGFIFFRPEFALPMLIALFMLYGAHYGIVTTIQSPFVADMSKSEVRASSVGLYKTINGLCMFVASFAAGLIWDRFSASATFGFGAVFSLLGAFLLFVLVKESPMAVPLRH